MGYMRHHAIIVTSFDDELAAAAHAKADELGAIVTNIVSDSVNGNHTFLFAPDGSKEGWGESARGDSRRDEMVDWLDSQRHEDDSTSIDWVEVQYGDDEAVTRIVRDGDAHYRARWANV